MKCLKTHFLRCHSQVDPKKKENENCKTNESRTVTLECNICSATLNSSKGLKNHLRYVHYSQNFDYKCQICSNSFKSTNHLKHHVKNVHNKIEKEELNCDLCGFTFTGKTRLRYHKNTVHIEAKPKKCDICDREFDSVWTFKQDSKSFEVLDHEIMY